MTPKFPSSVPPPESLKSVGALLREMIANTNIDETIRRRLQDRLLSEPKMLDIRPIHPERYLANNAAERGLHSQLWMKARGRLGICAIYLYKSVLLPGDHVMVHLSTAAFASDYGLLSAAIRHVPSVGFAASLDHSMWIHEFRFRMDDWCLYDVECSSIGRQESDSTVNNVSVYRRRSRSGIWTYVVARWNTAVINCSGRCNTTKDLIISAVHICFIQHLCTVQ